jgi:uncharacterized protein YecT (DUF1311 family)
LGSVDASSPDLRGHFEDRNAIGSIWKTAMRYILVATHLLVAPILSAAAQDASLPNDRAAIEGCLQKRTDAPERCIGIVYNACVDEPSSGTTVGMGECAHHETQVWQEMIDAHLQRLLAGPLGETQAEPHNRPTENKREHAVPGSDLIDDMQRTWLIWRAKMCDLLNLEYEGGSLARVVYGKCFYEETGRHALWLKALADEIH